MKEDDKDIKKFDVIKDSNDMPGDLFLKKDWEKNQLPNCGVLSLWILKEIDNED